ncbi:mucoidy inhibitor MuiA family protein [Proteus penneri]|uniref:Mucoidy inhibitor MuiA family protein n=2 Tax=Morganellaceae TaxID=1903414 RepID=A0ABS0VZH2_9GAMM|nr:mucoidy inhibitor MuiA family protein [Proteus penneri]NBM67769.1 mucoidy inhibitor MuiA family protein [Proteus sp. G2663]NBM98212.1 mucoidy inhibitor MuiA family protein [Proteus sp. G2660]NBN03773.1 mucoidy inhibitor MuiA family protein [Proteus sp. G2665]QPT35440.1 mucoidy inhibitor MuiA family protein [Proteus penneri]
MIKPNKLTLSLFILSIISTSNALANEPNSAELTKALYQDVKLNQATIFLRGAELENSTTLNLPAGQSEVVLSNVANNIDPKSLSISLDNDDVVINTINVKKIPIAPSYPSAITVLMEKQRDLNKRIEELNININVGDEQIALLKDQSFFGYGETQSLEQSSQKFDFISKKMTSILNQQKMAREEIAELTEKLEELSRQLEIDMPIIAKEKTQIVLSLGTSKNLTSKMRISYITPDAGWSPAYDIRSQGMGKPILLTYKADVIQNTGLNWDKVKLVLTSTNPSLNITAPTLSPWYLALYNDNAKFRSKSMSMDMAAPVVPSPALMGEESYEKQLNKGVTRYVTTNNNGINLSHTIALPYTLKNSTETNTLVINQKEVTADYRYLTTPKLVEEVYLQAEVKDWENLNLLNGRANIYYMNSFVGNTYINTNELTELLNIPLGIDKNIQISRINNEKIRKEPIFIGTTIEQKESYTIKVRNTYDTPVKVTIYDQLPLSQENNINVANADYKDGVLDKDTGEIEWSITLGAKQEKSLPLNYTLSYPKNRQVMGL